MNRIAVRTDRGDYRARAVFLGEGRREHGLRAMRDEMPERGRGVGRRERDAAYAVAMARDVIVDRAAGPQRRAQHEADVALRDHVGGTVGEPGLGAGVGQRPEAEGGDVVLRGLFCVADPQLEVVEAQRAAVIAADGERSGHRHTIKIPRDRRERGGRAAIIR